MRSAVLFFAVCSVGCATVQNTQKDAASGGNPPAANAEVSRANPLGSLRPHHVALSVPDLDEAVRWYEEKFGFRVIVRREFPPIRTRAANLELNGFQIELFEREHSTPPREARRNPYADDLLLQGVKHIAFVVDDLEATVAELKKRNVEFASEPESVDALRMRLCFIRVNNGYLIELGQRTD